MSMKFTREMIRDTSCRVLGEAYTEQAFLPMMLRELCVAGYTRPESMTAREHALVKSAWDLLSELGHIPDKWESK